MTPHVPEIITRFFKKRNESEKKSIISRRFIIAVSIIYSALIIAMSITFHLVMSRNGAILRDTLVLHNQEVITVRAQRIVEGLKIAGASSSEDIGRELQRRNAAGENLLGAIIFTKTEDENYYRVAGARAFHDDFTLAVSRSAVVKEQKNINYLKMGMLHSAVDPDMYTQNGYVWQNVYLPYEMGKRKAVLQLLVPVSRTQSAIDSCDESARSARIVVVTATVVLVLAVMILSIIFLQNYSLLINNLALYMKKAAEGDLEVSLNQSEDDELSQLASSFNTLIDELKDKTGKTVQESEGIGSIFNTGVSLLKNGDLDDAIAIFKTLTIIKPNAFGSYFNLGVAYAKKRDYQTAIRMFEEAGRINPAFDMTGTYIEKIKRLQNPDA